MEELERRLERFGIRPGLERVTSICKLLGNPQDRMKVILVTGTNGKGSVTVYLASMLSAAGHRTGSYFSPHIVRYNERIKIDGKEITDEEFKPYEREVLRLHDGGQEMTVFEALTAIAYRYFADKGCEYAVVEIGLGGRYDATNVAKERAAIITNVELEHTEYLGKTIADIAWDKSHIIKSKDCIAITGCTGDALAKVRERADAVGCKLRALGKDFSFTLTQTTMTGNRLDYHGKKERVGLFIPLAGRYQADNAALAIAAAEELGLDDKSIRSGLGKTAHPGRLQVISKDPLVLVDGAHNPAGIRTIVQNLDIYPRERLVCVFSALEDKDWKDMLAILAPECDAMVINQIRNKRAEKAGKIAEEAKRYTKAEVVEDIKESLIRAKELAGKKGMVLVCGSLYMLEEIMD
jgi:dihydrofolate synthase / folylpolyglutamate synthase